MRAACVLPIAATFFVVASVSRAVPVAAQETLEPIRFDVHFAAVSCPDGAFLERVKARTTRFRMAADDEPARAFKVDIDLDKEGVVGRLVVRELDGRESERVVPGQSCQDVVDALGLFAALAIDPTASLGPPAPPPVLAPVVVPPPPPKLLVQEPRRAVHLDLGAAGGVVAGMSPDAMAVVEGFIDVTFEGRGAFRPLIRLAGQLDTGPPVTAPTGSAEFRLWAGELDFCPFGLGPKAFSVRLCAGIQAGVYGAAGQEVAGGRARTTPWFAGVAAIRARWFIASPVFLELSPSLFVPATRPTVFFAPNVTVYDVPATAEGATLSLGVQVY